MRQSQALHDLVNAGPQVKQAVQLQQMADGFTASSALQLPHKQQTGLPDVLKTGMEQLSGYAMDDVSVHYNSPEPAELRAHAFARGTDIHLAAGQEKHLPHEAWHVVQQKQGRVKSTIQLKGEAVNDNSELEQEADEMGRKALTSGLSQRFLPKKRSLRSGPVNQLKVFQLLSTQINIRDTDKRIAGIIVRGRPPLSYQGSMGDHTTAFILQTEGLNIALNGLGLDEALNYLETLPDYLMSLPGYPFLQVDFKNGKANTPNGGLFVNEYTDLMNHLKSARVLIGQLDPDKKGNSGPEAAILSELQLAINAYLCARELIPFSTINMAAHSKGSAGKGKGEAFYAAVVSTYEREGEESGVTETELVNAVLHLFDDRAAGVLATANDAKAQELTGISFSKNISANGRLSIFRDQHRKTIQKLFPQVYKVVENHLLPNKMNNSLHAFKSRNLLSLLNEGSRLIESLFRSIRGFTGQKNRIVNGKKLNMEQLKKISEIHLGQERVLQVLEEIYPLNEELDQNYGPQIARIERRIMESVDELNVRVPLFDEQLRNWVNETLQDESHHLTNALTGRGHNMHAPLQAIQNTWSFQRGHLFLGFKPVFYDGSKSGVIVSNDNKEEEEDTEMSDKPVRRSLRNKRKAEPDLKELEQNAVIEQKEKQKISNVKTDTLISSFSPMSIQLTTDPKGIITGMVSDGRPASPFTNTMGAHTTSWVVHLDRVRSLVRGVTVDEAATKIQGLLEEIEKVAKDLETRKMGNKASRLYDDAHASMMRYKKYDSFNLGSLQDMIVAVLSLYNLIPGVSVARMNTNGHGEAMCRKILVDFEQNNKKHGRNEIIRAIKGLFDGGNNGYMRNYHLKIIAQAYPKSYAYGFGKVQKDDQPSSVSLQKQEDPMALFEKSSSATLSEEQLQHLAAAVKNETWRNGPDNGIIHALTDGAGISPASEQQLFTIRKNAGAPAEEPLLVDGQTLDMIAAELGILDRGAVIVYEGDTAVNGTSMLKNPVYVYFDFVRKRYSPLMGRKKPEIQHMQSNNNNNNNDNNNNNNDDDIDMIDVNGS